MKRTFTLVLMTILLIGVFVLTVSAEETPTLLYKTSATQQNANPLSSYPLSPDKTTNIFLYYGTPSGTQTALTAGTLTSSKENILTVSRDGTRYQFTPKAFGTVTLTYTEGSTVYTTEVTVSLPNNSWHTTQTRSETNFISSYTLPPTGTTTLWYLSEYGFSFSQVQNLSAFWRMNSTNVACGDGVTVTPVKRNAADTDEAARYDIKVIIDSDMVKLPQTNSSLRVLSKTMTSGSSLTLKMQEKPALLYKTSATQKTANPLSSYTLSPGGTSNLYLYYGTPSGTQTALTAGTLTSSKENILTVSRDGTRYQFTPKAFGTVTLTYTEGSTVYTTEVTVSLPNNSWHTAQPRSETNFISSYTLPASGTTTLWYLSEYGFSFSEVQNLSAVWYVNKTNVACGNGVTVAPVKRNAADTDAEARYDIKVVIDSDTVELPQANSSLKLLSETMTSSRNLPITMQEIPTLLYKTSTTQKTTNPLSSYAFAPGRTPNLYLYYGTPSGTQTALTAGTLTSSNENILTVSQNGDHYQLTPKTFGTVTLTYTDGSTVYTADVTVSLPATGWYTAQMRSETNFISSYTLPASGTTTLWYLSTNGFTFNQVQNLSAFWQVSQNNVACGDGVTVAPVKRNAADTDAEARYDIKVVIDSDTVELPQANSSLKLLSETMTSSRNLPITMQEIPTLLYKTSTTQKTTNPLSSYAFAPGRTPNLYLYYGTPSGTQTALTAGTLTSSNENILTVSQNGDHYQLTPKTFGTVTLTYTDGSTVYTADVTVSLPATGWYTAQMRSETNFISSYTLPASGTTTLWYLSTNGLTYTEIQGLSANWVESRLDVACGNGVTATPVKRNAADSDTAARYDIKVTFDSSVLEMPVNTNSFRLHYTKANGSGTVYGQPLSLQMAQKPGLLFRMLNKVNHTPQDNPTAPLLSIEQLPIQLDSSTLLRFYYGTTDAYVPVTDPTLLSGKGVELVTMMAGDGGLCWELKYVEPGETVLQYRYTSGGQSLTGTHTLLVALPEYAFFSAQARTLENYLPEISWFDLENGVIWFLSENGFTTEECAQIKVKVNYNRTDFSNFSIAWAERPGAAGRYDLKIALPKPPSGELNYSLQVEQNGRRLISNYTVYAAKKIKTDALYLGDYVVGFSFMRDELIDIIEGGTQSMGNTSVATPSENDPYRLFKDFNISAAEIKADSEGAKYYEVLPGNKAKITVSKVWIEPLYGTEAVFSLSDKAYVTEVVPNADGSNWELYFKQSRYAHVRLCATVTATIEGKTVSGDIGFTCFSDYRSLGEYDCAILDVLTVEDYIDENGEFHQGLNSLLQKIAAEDKNPSITVRLADADYVGTVTIPSTLGTRLNLRGKTNTRLIGSVDLNETAGLDMSHICFIAPERSSSSTEIKAIHNGEAQASRCVFYGYDVALDTSWKGIVSAANGNIFINNTIAIRFDIGLKLSGFTMFRKSWENNTFINNGTAVQVLSLNKYASPYYFRFINSNFINNDTDFDVCSGGTLYMYKNYFGEYIDGKPNGSNKLRLSDLLGAKTEGQVDRIVKRCKPKVHTENGSRVITNPRWKFPVLDWWTGAPLETLLFGDNTGTRAAALFMAPRAEAPYENILLADWENDTQIVNSDIDAENLLIDGSAFEENGEKKIDIVEGEEETYVGSWIFD